MRLSLFNRFDTLNDTSTQPITIQFTGPLVLHADPNEPLHVATKRYVDNRFSSGLNAANITSGIIAGSRLPAFLGDVTSPLGSTVFTLSNTGVVAGNYTKFTVDAKGRITAGSLLSQSDIPNLSWSKINVSRPTTLAGYGITDGVRSTGDSLVGTITVTGTPSLNLHAATKQYVDLQALSLNGSEPTGTVVTRATEVAPQSYLRCDGGEISKTTYAALYAVIGDRFGSMLMPGAGKPWKQQYEINTEQSTDITGWVGGPSLPEGLGVSQAIVTKNRVYLLGGSNNYGIVSTLYTAPINPDGTLGAWNIGPNLPEPLSASQAIVTKNRVYMLGGWDNSDTVSTVYTSPINEDGTLGTWTTGTSLPGAFRKSQAIVTTNRVYLLGGYNNDGYVSTVYAAPINEDGTLGTWATIPSLPEGLGVSQAIVTKNRVYLLGGSNNYGSISTVYTASINEDGTLGAWSTGTSLPGPLGYSQAIVTKNRVYLLGGHNGSDTVSTVYTSPINEDGTLGTWTTGTSLPGAFFSSQAIVTKNQVYLLGGIDNDGSISTVYTAPFSGGLNSYSGYYDGSILSLSNTTHFRLPDYSNKETLVEKYYIKYN